MVNPITVAFSCGERVAKESTIHGLIISVLLKGSCWTSTVVAHINLIKSPNLQFRLHQNLSTGYTSLTLKKEGRWNDSLFAINHLIGHRDQWTVSTVLVCPNDQNISPRTVHKSYFPYISVTSETFTINTDLTDIHQHQWPYIFSLH